MSLQLELHTRPDVPLEAHVLCPDKLAGMDAGEVEKQPVYHGNRTQVLGDFFRVRGRGNGELVIEGDLSLVKHIGDGMQTGSIIINGNAGAHLGAEMRGGLITVNGNTGDWLAPEMRGGRVEVLGNAGHMAGSAYRGSPSGMENGEIIIHGSVSNEVGHGMRSGLIAVGGNAGDFTGVNMLAGTIIILGTPGIRPGAGMKRGTIVLMTPVALLPTFTYSCVYQPAFLRLYLGHLRDAGMQVSEEQILASYDRWCGDRIELNRGEILLYHS